MAAAITCFLMSGITKTSILAEEGVNHCRKRSYPTSEQSTKRSKSDENMSANEKISNFSMLTPNSNGTVKINSSPMNKPGAATKKLVIKNFKSMFTFVYRHFITSMLVLLL